MKHQGPTVPEPSPNGDRTVSDINQIDAALKRIYRVPTGLGARLRRTIEAQIAVQEEPGVFGKRMQRERSQGGGFMDQSLGGLRTGPSLALASAAALILFVVPRPHGTTLDSDSSSSVAAAAATRNDSLAAIQIAQGLGPVEGSGPLVGDQILVGSNEDCPENRIDFAPLARQPHRAPDLALLYHEVVASAGTQAGQIGQSGTCASPSGGDSLSASLRVAYGVELRVGEDASRFAGPFPMAEWRGGTVLAGFPEEGGLPSVVIAESESSLSCCIDLVAPRDPSLRVFAWHQGALVLIEITQRKQPRFLDRFELL